MTKSTAARQIDLFEHVAGAYAQPQSGRLTNAELYRMAVGRAGVDPKLLNETAPVGRAGDQRSLLKRAIRWHQQTLRSLGLIERVEGERAVWELTEAGKKKMRTVKDNIAAIAFSTDLGLAIWGNCHHVFSKWDEPIFLALTSTPYPLQKPRAYGNPPVEDFIDFISRVVEPIANKLVPGGNILLSLSNDVHLPKSPARSLYFEKLTIALCERFGLYKMDTLIWESNKAPGPIQWASLQRMQFNTAYEPILWLCNDPVRCIANNQRVLEPHTEQHQKLIDQGGVKHVAVNGDGVYRLRPGSYGNPTAGRIPRNVLHVPNNCASQRAYKKRAREIGLQPHGAPMPLALARKLIRFMTDVDQLVVDPCAGSMTTALASELEGRRWAATDVVYDYVRGAAERFRQFEGFDLALDAA
ncbi:DNA methyltransferase [Ralstonia sp. ASV6]|uniref:DNA methyltransferase n=1 Tax=Ralstonia sp. ASV6 TaxID=2795124 RepID=UPI0018EAB9EF|nr:DNA methyltransferase [Ralstonia sp. ASV6]